MYGFIGIHWKNDTNFGLDQKIHILDQKIRSITKVVDYNRKLK